MMNRKLNLVAAATLMAANSSVAAEKGASPGDSAAEALAAVGKAIDGQQRAALAQRYIVIKLGDLKPLQKHQLKNFQDILKAISRGRVARGAIPEPAGLVIEKDWPEYAPTRAALLARINGEPLAPVEPTAYTEAREAARRLIKEQHDGTAAKDIGAWAIEAERTMARLLIGSTS